MSTRVLSGTCGEYDMFYSVNAELAGMDCKYCFSADTRNNILLSVRKNDSSEQLLLDFSRKVHNIHEAAILPDSVLVFENNRYTEEVYLRLCNAKVVKPWIKRTYYHGIAVAICGLTDNFMILREGRKDTVSATVSGCMAYA